MEEVEAVEFHEQMEAVPVNGVNVIRWNPKRPLRLRPRRFFKWTAALPGARRLGNVGDVAGLEIVRKFSEELTGKRAAEDVPALAAIGSVIHMLPRSSVVWGAGVNGKHLQLSLPQGLDVRAVRGPRTQAYLEERGVECPDVFGDPGLFVKGVLPNLETPDVRHKYVVAPNLNDAHLAEHPHALSPLLPLRDYVQGLRAGEMVVASSLHGLIFAEAFGVPARAIVSRREPAFKYEDYYEGTGRFNVQIAEDVDQASKLGGVAPPEIDLGALAASFPRDLWVGP